MGELIGVATSIKDGLATKTMVKAAGLCFLVGVDSCLKFERDASINAPVLINITAFDGPTWSTNANPRKVLLSIPYDSGTIKNVYAKNLLDANDMQIYKDDSLNIYIKAMNAYSTVFVVELIQPAGAFSNVKNTPLSSVNDLEGYEKIIIH